MFVVAGDRQVGMLIAIGENPLAGNLSTIIDRNHACYCQVGTGKN
jgi:hypothetical protein